MSQVQKEQINISTPGKGKPFNVILDTKYLHQSLDVRTHLFPRVDFQTILISCEKDEKAARFSIEPFNGIKPEKGFVLIVNEPIILDRSNKIFLATQAETGTFKPGIVWIRSNRYDHSYNINDTQPIVVLYKALKDLQSSQIKMLSEPLGLELLSKVAKDLQIVNVLTNFVGENGIDIKRRYPPDFPQHLRKD